MTKNVNFKTLIDSLPWEQRRYFDPIGNSAKFGYSIDFPKNITVIAAYYDSNKNVKRYKFEELIIHALSNAKKISKNEMSSSEFISSIDNFGVDDSILYLN